MGKTDPRVLKTRRKLKAAFFKLLENKKLMEINVKDLTETAGVTRGTFYLHFKDKDEFTHQMMNESISDFFETVIFERELPDGNIQPRLSLTHVFSFADEKPAFFASLLNDKDAIIYRNQLSKEIFSYIEKYDEATHNTAEVAIPEELFLNYFIYGVLGFIDQWLREGKIYANHYMADNLYQLLDSKMIRDVNLSGFFVVKEDE